MGRTRTATRAKKASTASTTKKAPETNKAGGFSSRGQRKRRAKRDMVARKLDLAKYCAEMVAKAKGNDNVGPALGDFSGLREEVESMARDAKKEARLLVAREKRREGVSIQPTKRKTRDAAAEAEGSVFEEIYKNVFAGGANVSAQHQIDLTTQALQRNIETQRGTKSGQKKEERKKSEDVTMR